MLGGVGVWAVSAMFGWGRSAGGAVGAVRAVGAVGGGGWRGLVVLGQQSCGRIGAVWVVLRVAGRECGRAWGCGCVGGVGGELGGAGGRAKRVVGGGEGTVRPWLGVGGGR